MSGIRTLADLKDRCWLDDITDCWHWRGALSAKRRPSLWIPELRRVGTVGTFLTLLTGKSGGFWIPNCGERDCANPEHRRYGTASELAKLVRPSLPPLHRARVTAGRRRASLVTTEAKARLIRESSETLAVVALRCGMSVSMASKIRRREAWAPLNPWQVAA